MKHAILALAVLALIGGQASAMLFTDDFDSYADQAAFQTAWPIGFGVTGTLSTGSPSPVSSPNSINFGTAAARNDRSIGFEAGNPSATNSIRFSFDFYDSNGAAAAYRQIATIVDGAGTASGQLISLGLNNNIASSNYMARVLGVDGGTGAGSFFKLDDVGAPARSTGWHNLEVVVSFATATTLNYDFYVDDTLSKTLSDITVTFRSFDGVRIGSGLSSVNSANIDNVLVQNFDPTAAVPEVGSFAAVGLVGLLSVGAVWIRRRMWPVAA